MAPLFALLSVCFLKLHMWNTSMSESLIDEVIELLVEHTIQYA